LSNEAEDGLNFKKFCSIMGVDVEDATNEKDHHGMSPIVIPQLRTVLSGGPGPFQNISTRSNSLF